MSTKKLAAVVGATGFVGSHIVRNLLQKGYTVNCATRNVNGASWLKSLAKEDSKVNLFKLNLTTEGPENVDEMLALTKDCSSLFFAAGFETQEPATIDFMVNNALSCIKTARENKVGVVVLTSSGSSTNPKGHKNETPKQEHVHWSDPAEQIGRKRFSPAAKTTMELKALEEVGRDKANKIANKEVAENSPRLVILNPNLILGPQLQPGSVKGNSLPWMKRIILGETMNETIPNDSMSIIDVRDLAALHVAASEKTDAHGKYFGVDQSYPWKNILAAIQKAYPAYKMPAMFEGDSNTPTQFDHTRKKSLGVPIRSLQETINGLLEFMIERGVLKKKEDGTGEETKKE
eukprot:g3883.t1